MSKIIRIASIIACILIILTAFPTLNPQTIRINAVNVSSNLLDSKDEVDNIETVEMILYHIKEDKTYKKTVKRR